MSRYFEQEYKPAVDFFSYPDIHFRWSMEGKVQAFLNEGINSLNERKLNLALSNFEQAIKLAPALYPGFYYQGICNKLLLNLGQAEKDFTMALQLNDTLAEAYVELGEIYEALKDLKKAEHHYNKSINVSNRFPDGYFHLANLQFSQNNLAEAKELYLTCTKVDPRFSKSYVMMGRLAMASAKDKKEAMMYFNLAVKADSSSREGLFWRGLMNADLGEPQKSLTDWNNLVRYNPDNPFFLFMRGYLLIEMGEIDKAFGDFRKAITANPENTDKFVGGQTILDKRIDLQSSARLLIQKLYGFKEPDITYLKNGFCFLLAGRYQGAINWFYKVRTKSGVAYFFQGLTFEHAGIHDRALVAYNEAIKADSEIVDAYKKRAIYRMELGEYPGAKEDLSQMIRLEPESFVSYKLRGIAKALSDDCEGAIADLSAFIKSDSTDRESFKTRAYCREKTKMWSEAGYDFMMALHLGEPDDALYVHTVDNFMRAIFQHPDDQQLRFYLGKTLFQAGDKKSGLRQLKMASDKGYAPAKELLRSIKD